MDEPLMLQNKMRYNQSQYEKCLIYAPRHSEMIPSWVTPTTHLAGATGSENQITAVRVGVCEANDKSEHYHRPLDNRIKAGDSNFSTSDSLGYCGGDCLRWLTESPTW